MKANRKIHPRTLNLLALGFVFASNAVILLTSSLEAAELPDPQKALQAFYASKPELCRQMAEAALKAKPKNSTEWQAVLARSMSYRDPRGALSNIDLALAAEPKNCKYLARKAFLLMQVRQLVNAIATAQSAIALCPTNALSQAVMATCQYSRGNLSPAQDGFAKAILNDDEESEYDVLLLAVTYYEHTEDEVEARHCMDILSKKYPNSSQVIFARAMLRRDMGEFEPALKDFERAYELDPTFVQSLSLRGNLLMRLERFPEAVDDYNKVVAVEPRPEVYGRMADCFRVVGNTKKAIEYYDQAIKLSNGPSIKTKVFSQHPLISAKGYKANWLRQTQLFEKTGQFDRAIANATEILRVDTRCPTALQIRQEIYLRQKRYADAIKDLTRLIELDPDVSAWHTARGKAYKALNDSSKAEADFAKAKHIDNFGK